MLTLFNKISKLKIRETNIHAKSIVIELYSPDETCHAAIKRELSTNFEIGNEFRKKAQQATRFIYALNEEIDDEINDQSVINVADEHGLHVFSKEIKSGDSLIIVAQGDINQQRVAGCTANELVEILHEDLELDLNTLKSVELFAANMGDCEQFRKKLAESCRTDRGTFTDFIHFKSTQPNDKPDQSHDTHQALKP